MDQDTQSWQDLRKKFQQEKKEEEKESIIKGVV